MLTNIADREEERTARIYMADEGIAIPIADALELMTDEWIRTGQYCDSTIRDMRNALTSAIKAAKPHVCTCVKPCNNTTKA